MTSWVKGFGTITGSIRGDFLEEEELQLLECVGSRTSVSQREGCVQRPGGIISVCPLSVMILLYPYYRQGYLESLNKLPIDT